MKDTFCVEKLAQEYCAQHCIEESDPAYRKVIAAHMNGFSIGSPSHEARLGGQAGEEVGVVAWIRKWAYDGETPAKEKNESGRMAWPFKFKLVPVSERQCLKDDEPLMTVAQHQRIVAQRDAKLAVLSEALRRGVDHITNARHDVEIRANAGNEAAKLVLAGIDSWLANDALAALAAAGVEV